MGKNKKETVTGCSEECNEFDLEKEKSLLDEQGLRIAENQENSQKNRRKLAESTRDFKKASPEDKLSMFNSLLKGYQEEVDNITKRAKFGENAFLNIYQKLYEAPDPFPALASIAEQDRKLSEVESENRKIKVELEEYRTEATHLKNQQATIRRLEERNRQLEQQMEEKIKEVVEIKQRNLAEENQKTMELLKDREQALQDQLRQAKDSVSTMQKLHKLAQSQLFELRAQSDEDTAAKQSEVSLLLMDEVERAQTRLLTLEREKGHLRSQLQTANEDTENKKSDNADSNSMLENSLTAKEKIISEVNIEIHNVETALANERESHVAEIKKLNLLLKKKDTIIEELKKELQERPSAKLVDDLHKKVKILQAVGYNSIEAEDWDAATTGEEMSKMESLLLDKNRKMEHEVTQLKVQLSEKTSLLEKAEANGEELTAKVNEQQRLIQKLEDDDILKTHKKEPKPLNSEGHFSSEMTVMTTELLPDLVEEVLCRVPATHLKRLRYICKGWNRLIKDDKRFQRNHFDKAAKQFLPLVLRNDYRVCSLSVNLHGAVDVTIESKNGVDIHRAFHCDGLLLCTSEDRSTVVVWNPYTGGSKWIHSGNLFETNHREFYLGYCKDNNSGNKSYKFLSKDTVETNQSSLIYDFDSDSWRIVDDVTQGWFAVYNGWGVSLKGNIYWIVKHETDMDISLLRFDFSTEKSQPVPLPYQCFSYANLCLSVVRDEKLSVLVQLEPLSKTEIWVTNKIDETTNVVSWTKVLALDLSPDLQFSYEGSFLLNEEKKVVVCCDRWMDKIDETMSKDMVYIVGEDNKVTSIVLGVDTYDGGLPVILNYVPSLVQI